MHSIAAMKARWLFDREDPRTVLLGSIFILAFGLAIGRSMLDSDLPVVLVIAWFVASVAQVIWAAFGYRRWRRERIPNE